LKIISYWLFLFTNILSVAQNSNSIKETYFFKETVKEVLKEFPKEQFPQKRRAALFLLKNMKYHNSKVPYWVDSLGENTSISEFDYKDFKRAKKAFDDFSEKNYKLTYQMQHDTKYLSPDFIINSINGAFTTWKKSPWYTSYSFKTFCEYVLPYRNNTEPIVKDWRTKYNTIYKKVIEQAEDKQDPVSVCSALIKNMKYFRFVLKKDYSKYALSIDQMHFRGDGNCTDLVGVATLAGRSLGLAISTDFTPYYAASSSSHFWNTIVDKQGNHIPFNATAELPYIYNPNVKRLGKVLRATYGKQKNSLPNFVENKKIPSKKLKGLNVLDVTEEYVETKDLNYTFQEGLSEEVAYISVFNKGAWRPIWWGISTDKKTVKFNKMGTNIVYLAAQVYEKKNDAGKKKMFRYQLEPHPVLLDKKGVLTTLKPNIFKPFSYTISRLNIIQEGASSDFNSLKLVDDEKYILYYWDKKWIKQAEAICVNGNICYDNLPRNALFTIKPEKPDGFERIFTINSKDSTLNWF